MTFIWVIMIGGENEVKEKYDGSGRYTGVQMKKVNVVLRAISSASKDKCC